MPNEKKTAQKIEDLSNEINGLIGRYRELARSLQGLTEVEIANDMELKNIQSEFNELEQKIESMKLSLEQLQIIAPLEEKIEVIKALMPIGKFIVDGFKGEISEIINELASALIDVREGIDDQLARLSKIKAKSQFRQFSDLQEAGFNQNQAFMLTLASVHPINWSEMAKDGAKKVSRPRTKPS